MYNGLKMKPGKFYVLDQFTGPVCGPFDTAAAAEAERVQINIADDCVVGESYLNDKNMIQMREAVIA